jgi:hypothetical protein
MQSLRHDARTVVSMLAALSLVACSAPLRSDYSSTKAVDEQSSSSMDEAMNPCSLLTSVDAEQLLGGRVSDASTNKESGRGNLLWTGRCQYQRIDGSRDVQVEVRRWKTIVAATNSYDGLRRQMTKLANQGAVTLDEILCAGDASVLTYSQGSAAVWVRDGKLEIGEGLTITDPRSPTFGKEGALQACELLRKRLDILGER